jgi:hypothetical protein
MRPQPQRPLSPPLHPVVSLRIPFTPAVPSARTSQTPCPSSTHRHSLCSKPHPLQTPPRPFRRRAPVTCQRHPRRGSSSPAPLAVVCGSVRLSSRGAMPHRSSVPRLLDKAAFLAVTSPTKPAERRMDNTPLAPSPVRGPLPRSSTAPRPSPPVIAARLKAVEPTHAGGRGSTLAGDGHIGRTVRGSAQSPQLLEWVPWARLTSRAPSVRGIAVEFSCTSRG